MASARWHALGQLILSRVREFIREPHAIFWVYGFPIILAVGLGLAFSNSETKPPPIDIASDSDSPERAKEIAQQLEAEHFEVQLLPTETCAARMNRGRSSLYLIVHPHEVEYVYDKARPEGVQARYWIEAVVSRPFTQSKLDSKETYVARPGTRYIDFLLPGLIGMNLMGGGLFGVGFVLVDMRVRKLFKRLMATPMRHSDFLLSLILSRLMFLFPEMGSLLLLGGWWFGVPIYGSVALVLFTVFLGASAFAGIGLLLGCRTEKMETISGLSNLVMLPQYLLSGIFFSPERFPDFMQPLIQALPLTQLNETLREVMLQGSSLQEVAWRLGILAAWAIVTFTLALRWLKWR
jgi:ABC-2 type transport system permease protein